MLPQSTTPMIELEYDPKTYLLAKEIIYQFNEDAKEKKQPFCRLEVSMNHYENVKQNFPDSQYPVNKYVSVSNGKIKLSNEFKSYQLINYL